MRSIISIFLLSFLFFGCKKTDEHSKNKLKNKDVTLVKPITNFLFLKNGMTSDDVEKELLKRKINYKFISDKNYAFNNISINSFNSYNKNYNLKILKGKSLKILSYEIKDFELGFVNDTLAIFRYYNIAEEPEVEYVYAEMKNEKGETVIDIMNKDFSDNWYKANREYEKNIFFFSDYYNALKEKYGKCDKIIGGFYENIERGKETDEGLDINKFWSDYNMMPQKKSNLRGMRPELVYHSISYYLIQRDWSNDLHKINISLKRRTILEMFRVKNMDAVGLPHITIIDVTAKFEKNTLKKIYALHKKQLNETIELNKKINNDKMKLKRKKELDSL